MTHAECMYPDDGSAFFQTARLTRVSRTPPASLAPSALHLASLGKQRLLLYVVVSCKR